MLRNVLTLFFLLVPATAMASPAGVPERANPFMRVFGHAPPPHGFVRFCDANPRSCAAQNTVEPRIQATADRVAELEHINHAVNIEILPATDFEVYGVDEYWTIPTVRGDCEDYALLKRQRLIQLGWPPSALLMTVVKDEKGEGHAVLTARTAQGDFVLDNKLPNVRPWHKTPYEFIMRQSYLNPRVWVFLDPREGSTPLPIAGVRNAR